MNTKNLIGYTKRIRDIVIGNPQEDLGKTLPECLIEMSFDFNIKDAKRALKLTEQMELDVALLKRALRQLISVKK